jgi:TonB-linked SusC/RagA family outer membrane protein
MKRILLIIFLSLLYIYVEAQDITVTGKVADEDGMPLPGVFVLLDGSSIGTSTDSSGKYSIKAPADASLTFTCIGFKEQTVQIKGRTLVDVVLKEDSQMLEETVVVGYGTQKSKDLTAPIVSIRGDDLTRHIASSPMSGLQGRIAGVHIIGSGAPGASPSVRIRGMGSIGDYAQPLYIIDGSFVDNLDFISPSDIQDVTVLKDASASAIYGVRAANGVVILTTKKGTLVRTGITYDGYAGIQVPVNVMKLSDREQYVEMLNEANAQVSGYVPKDPSQFPASQDWYSVLLRKAFTQSHSLDVSGATEKTSYSMGLSYFNQDGILDADTSFDRLNFRSKVDQTVTPWLSVGANLLLSRYSRSSSDNNAFFQAFVNPPVYNVFNESNDAAYPQKYDSPQLYGFGNAYANPYAVARYNENVERGTNLVFSTYAQISFLNDKLKLKTSYNLDFQSYRNQGYVPEYFVGGSQGVSVSTLTKIYGQGDSHIIDNTLTYSDLIGQHGFSVMAGQSTRIERFSAMN